MHARILTLLLTAAVAVPAAAAPPAQDKGKALLGKAFGDTLGGVADATVRVLADGKEAALGAVMSDDGYILTKGSELRGTLRVKTRDGTTYDAEYVGYHRETDLALLKVDGEDLKTVKFAPSKEAETGNWVAVTTTASEPVGVGVVSNAVRKLYGPERIPENLNKGYIGIIFAASGLEVGSVVKGAAAEKAKMKAGDVIVEVAGTKVKSRDDLMSLLDVKRPGDVVAVKVSRKGKDAPEEVEFKVTLGGRNQMQLSEGEKRAEWQNTLGGKLSGRRSGFEKIIQHDIIVEPKDIGGPLVDLDGRVLGLNIARAGRVETWALPEEVITPAYKDLKAGKFPPPTKPDAKPTKTEPTPAEKK